MHVGTDAARSPIWFFEDVRSVRIVCYSRLFASVILRRACALFPDSTPSPYRDTRQDQLEAITDDNEDVFEQLDAEFYAYPDDIAEMLSSYWDAHGG